MKRLYTFLLFFSLPLFSYNQVINLNPDSTLYDLHVLNGVTTPTPPPPPSYDYYFSSDGNDSNTGTSPGQAWETITKLNTEISAGTFNNKTVAFNRGDTLRGQIIINEKHNVSFDAYGTGSDPILTTLQIATTWVNHSGNIWRHVDASIDGTERKLFIDGSQVDIGRHPNGSTYLKIGTYDGSSPFTWFNNADAQGWDDHWWDGGEVVVQERQYTQEVQSITDQTGDVITHDAFYYGISEYGGDYYYYLQNHIHALDSVYEWSVKNDTIFLYTTTDPNILEIQYSTENYVLYAQNSDTLSFENVNFMASNLSNLLIRQSDSINFDNVSITYAGFDGIRLDTCNRATLDSMTVQYIGNRGLWEANCDTLAVTNSIFYDIGLDRGLGCGQGAKTSAMILQGGDSLNIQYNKIRRIGYIGIGFYNNLSTKTWIHYNLLDSCVMTKVDGAAIYTWMQQNNSDNVIDHNIVLHNENTSANAMMDYALTANMGIYLDDLSGNFTVSNNTSYHAFRPMYLHSTDSCIITNNVLYDGNYEALAFVDASTPLEMNEMTFTDNIFVNAPRTLRVLYFSQTTDEFNTGTVTFDGDVIADPFHPRATEMVIDVYISNPPGQENFADWAAESFTANQYDAYLLYTESGLSQQDSLIVFEYNATKLPVVYELIETGKYDYFDVYGVEVTINPTIQPYESLILYRKRE